MPASPKIGIILIFWDSSSQFITLKKKRETQNQEKEKIKLFLFYVIKPKSEPDLSVYHLHLFSNDDFIFLGGNFIDFFSEMKRKKAGRR